MAPPREPKAGVDPARCPLCGEANRCGMTAGEETCWCFDQQLSPAALARIPERARGVACICRACGAPPERPLSGP